MICANPYTVLDDKLKAEIINLGPRLWFPVGITKEEIQRIVEPVFALETSTSLCSFVHNIKNVHFLLCLELKLNRYLFNQFLVFPLESACVAANIGINYGGYHEIEDHMILLEETHPSVEFFPAKRDLVNLLYLALAKQRGESCDLF